MNRLELLRHIVANLHVQPLTAGLITEQTLDASPFARARLGPQGTIGVLRAGGEALSDLADAIFRDTPHLLRGSTFEDVSNEVFVILIQNFLGHKASEITAADLTLVEHGIEQWFAANSGSHHLYIPCILTPRPAPMFQIGPILFTFIDDFVEHLPKDNQAVFDLTYGGMLKEMASQRAGWMAEVAVDRCMRKRAEELAELSVDLAITALQIVIHPDQSRHMSRMTARTVPRYRFGLSEGGGMVSPTVTNQEPGLALGPGTFEHYLQEADALMKAAGAQILAFLTGSSALPILAGAWADAAYWCHEGLAEPLDTIAVPKLETAIEVLLRSESSSGSQKRVTEAIQVFYGLAPDQLINPTSQVTVKQFAKDLVRDRSRILHGTWSTLVHSMRASRRSLEGLVVKLLAHYMLEMQEYDDTPAAKDALDAFLSFVNARRGTP
jgi:hypothetical protein